MASLLYIEKPTVYYFFPTVFIVPSSFCGGNLGPKAPRTIVFSATNARTHEKKQTRYGPQTITFFKPMTSGIPVS